MTSENPENRMPLSQPPAADSADMATGTRRVRGLATGTSKDCGTRVPGNKLLPNHYRRRKLDFGCARARASNLRRARLANAEGPGCASGAFSWCDVRYAVKRGKALRPA
jgi:hypothetical protein